MPYFVCVISNLSSQVEYYSYFEYYNETNRLEFDLRASQFCKNMLSPNE